MAPEARPLDPTFLALLQEAAAVPGSSFLRVTRPPTVFDFTARQSAFSPMTAGLASVERELLRVYRQELADLLIDAAAYKVFSAPVAGRVPIRHIRPNECFEPPSLENVGTRLHALKPWLVVPGDTTEGVNILVRLVTSPEHGHLTPVSLASAAHRLVPSHTGRLWAVVHLVTQGMGNSALQLLGVVLTNFPSHVEAACAWDNVAIARARSGHLDLAYAASVNATAVQTERIPSWLNRCVFSVQRGDRQGLLDATTFVTHLVHPEHPSLLSFLENAQAEKLSGAWTPTAEARAIAVRRDDLPSPLARRLAHVFA